MVKRIFRETEQRLQAVTDCPALEAALLIEACLGISREKIWAGADCQVDSVQIDRLEKMLWKRLQGYPLQYLLGEWEFYSLPFTVGEGVLIPRADTERLVDCALQFLQNRTMPRVLDLCSGSGCIAIAIAHEHPDCTVTAVELDEQAMEYLRTNIVRHHVPVCAVQADVLKGPQNLVEIQPEYDLIISNPPYIQPEIIDGLSREVQYEPRNALDGGPDGLMFYRALLSQWSVLLKPDGAMMVEIGYDQGETVHALMKKYFAWTALVQDYAGNDRVVIGAQQCLQSSTFLV